MIICIGGFPGSGRRRLTHDLSKALGFYIYPLGETKRKPSFKGLHKFIRPARGSPYPDGILIQIYKRIVADFPLVSKMYPDIIVKDHFHREIPREFFFAEAEKYFGPPIIVWVDASTEQSVARLRDVLTSKEKKLAARLAVMETTRRDYQPFTREIHTVDYTANAEAAVRHVLELVKKR